MLPCVHIRTYIYPYLLINAIIATELKCRLDKAFWEISQINLSPACIIMNLVQKNVNSKAFFFFGCVNLGKLFSYFKPQCSPLPSGGFTSRVSRLGVNSLGVISVNSSALRPAACGWGGSRWAQLGRVPRGGPALPRRAAFSLWTGGETRCFHRLFSPEHFCPPISLSGRAAVARRQLPQAPANQPARLLKQVTRWGRPTRKSTATLKSTAGPEPPQPSRADLAQCRW